jgi:RNA polymerase subunit RPABC4/transcription elongation factor Spt4
MSRVLKDYKCLDCRHLFEAWDPTCPECGSHNLATLFIQAPAIRTSQSATVKYPDKFTHDVCTASQGKETTDVVGEALLGDGDPRPGHGHNKSRPGTGMAWGEEQASAMLSQFNLPPVKKNFLPKVDNSGFEAIKAVRENKSRIMAP